MARLFRLIACLVALCGVTRSYAADLDGDGIADAHEKILGTDPAHAEKLQTIIEDGPQSDSRRKQPSYDASKDVLRVAFAHVGGNRYVWRVTCAAPPRPKDTVLHLYVNADANRETGRKASSAKSSYHGTDYMLTVAGGNAYSTHFAADGSRIPGPGVAYAVDGNSVLMSADVDLGRDSGRVRFDLYVLCHTVTKSGQSPGMSDHTRLCQIRGIPVSPRPKILRPGDHATNTNVIATFGLDIIRRVLADKQTVFLSPDKLALDGFKLDDLTSRRWVHLRRLRAGATAQAAAPKGTYHVGLLMYDDSRYAERLAIQIDDKLRGAVVADKDNNRDWLYCLAKPKTFRGGEKVQLAAGPQPGTYGIAGILFLPKPPEVRPVKQEIRHVTVAPAPDASRTRIVSWTTTWPCPTHLECGRDPLRRRVVRDDRPCLVHRAIVYTDTDRHGQILAAGPSGTATVRQECTFPKRLPRPAAKALVRRMRVPLTVRNPHSFALENVPVRIGVPLPRGATPNLCDIRLLRGREEVPAHVRPLGRWPDYTLRGVVVTFLADAASGGSSEYSLEFGIDVDRAAVPKPVWTSFSQHASLSIPGAFADAGVLKARIDLQGRLYLVQSGREFPLVKGAFCETKVAGASDQPCRLDPASATVKVEESGPLRAIVYTKANLLGPDKKPLVRVEKRIEFHVGQPWVRVRHTFTVLGDATFADLKSLVYRVPLAGAGKHAWRLALADGKSQALDSKSPSARQVFDGQLVLGGKGGGRTLKGRAVGALVSDVATVAVRDCWQNYPKGFSVGKDYVDIELCPPFEKGTYDKFPFEKEGHHLYYYLRDGKYRLRQGCSKTHEILLCFAPPEEAEKIAAVFQNPPVVTAPPKWYCDSGVFGRIAPQDPKHFGLYETAIRRNLKAYASRCERQRDYGMLNFGDWYGERGVNWGNIEYDTQHAMFLEFVRSGNPLAFQLAEQAERHNRDVDTCHFSPDSSRDGGVYVHQMGHVGGYYTKPVPGTLGFAEAGFTVSHAWVEGHFDHYYLTGDRRSYETGRAIADYFIHKELGRPYDFTTTRVPGWFLIMLAGAYRATSDPYYLNAARVVVERVLETQDGKRPLPAYQAKGRKPYQEGGWSRMMRPGHCQCEPRHRGNAGFMIAVLLTGLKDYYDLTGDERVKKSIIRGAHYLLDECYSDEVKGFRYTSCPNTKYRAGATPLMVEGIARAYLWTKDERFRRVLTEALPLSAHGSSYGKGFSMYYRAGPRVLADLAAAGITLNAPKGVE